MTARLRGERGQTALEYLGILAAVAGVLLVLIAVAPSVGERIACEIRGQIAKVTGGAGGGCGSPAASGEPTVPCIVADSGGKLEASLTVFSVKGGGEFRVLKQRRSDGNWLVTVAGGGELGAEFGLGGKADIEAGQTRVGGGAEVRGGVAGVGEGGGTWEFDDEAAANDFVDVVRNRARDGAIKGALPIVGHIGVAVFGEEREVPEADIAYVQGGVGADVTAGAGDVLGYVEGGLEGQAVLGTKIDRRSGERTVYFQLKGTGTGSAGALLGVSGQGDLEGQLGVTFDRSGRMVRATVTGKGAVAGSAPSLDATVHDPAQFLKSIKLVGQDAGGHRVELEGELDLTDPANHRALQQFLAIPAAGAVPLGARFAQDGEFNARTYAIEQERYGGGLSGALGIKFGIEGAYEGSNSRLTGAWYWTPTSGGVRPWTSCR